MWPSRSKWTGSDAQEIGREWSLLSCVVKRIEIKREINIIRIPFSCKARGVLIETQ